MKVNWLRAGSLGLLFFFAWNLFIQVAGTFRPDDPQPAGVNWGYIMQRAKATDIYGVAITEYKPLSDGISLKCIVLSDNDTATVDVAISLYYGGEWHEESYMYGRLVNQEFWIGSNTSLTPNTKYRVYVTAAFGGEYPSSGILDFTTTGPEPGGWPLSAVTVAVLALALFGVLGSVITKSLTVCLIGILFGIGGAYLASQLPVDSFRYVLTGGALLAAGFQCLFILRGVEHV